MRYPNSHIHLCVGGHKAVYRAINEFALFHVACWDNRVRPWYPNSHIIIPPTQCVIFLSSHSQVYMGIWIPHYIKGNYSYSLKRPSSQ